MKFIISINPDKFTECLNRVKAVYGNDVEVTQVGYTPENVPVPVPRWWSAGHDRWALTQGIITALETAYQAGEDCQIFEDDCIFREDASARIEAFLNNLPTDWDMAYLGGQLLAESLYPVQEVEGNEHVLLAKNAHRNHSWICKNASIPRVLEWFQIECWPGTHTADWRLGYLHLKPDFKVYIPKNGWIAGQDAGLSQLDGIEYPARWWHFTEPEKTQEAQMWQAFDTAKKEAEERQRFEEWKARMEARNNPENTQGE